LWARRHPHFPGPLGGTNAGWRWAPCSSPRHRKTYSRFRTATPSCPSPGRPLLASRGTPTIAVATTRGMPISLSLWPFRLADNCTVWGRRRHAPGQPASPAAIKVADVDFPVADKSTLSSHQPHPVYLEQGLTVDCRPNRKLRTRGMPASLGIRPGRLWAAHSCCAVSSSRWWMLKNLLRFPKVADYSATRSWRRTHRLAAPKPMILVAQMPFPEGERRDGVPGSGGASSRAGSSAGTWSMLVRQAAPIFIAFASAGTIWPAPGTAPPPPPREDSAFASREIGRALR